MAKKNIVEEDAEEPVVLPEHYRLDKGDVFIKYNSKDKRFSNLEEVLEPYSISLGEEPAEMDESGNPVPHVVDRTVWFDLHNNKVRVFKGHNTDGTSIWEIDPFGRRFVINNFSGDDADITGEIVNPAREASRKYVELARARLAELEPSPISVSELLDEVEPDDEDNTSEQDALTEPI